MKTFNLLSSRVLLYTLLILLFVSFSENSFSVVKNVPGNYTTIQSAVNAANNHDTVLVAPGTYFENINFRTKKIILTSNFILNHDTGYISKTIINGSKPTHADTASCVIIIGGQDSTAVLQGFTLTGGTGTAWLDEHGAGTFREGGAILIARSSPVIQYNLIKGNEAIIRIRSAGGGGIRCGDGSPKILNNVIINNIGYYGGGIVLNFCDAVIRNNIIANNSGGNDYGGGGIWIDGSLKKGNIIENNTIVYNHSNLDGGGIGTYDAGAAAKLKNNIIFNNSATSFPQISLRGASIPITYCDIEDGSNGIGNININPQFSATSLYLNNSSPCIDAGDPSNSNCDPADPQNTENAKFPSMGLIRNDIGAYGGPNATILPNFKISDISVVKATDLNNSLHISPNPFSNHAQISYACSNYSEITIYDMNGRNIKTYKGLKGTGIVNFDSQKLPSGFYICKMVSVNHEEFFDKIEIVK